MRRVWRIVAGALAVALVVGAGVGAALAANTGSTGQSTGWSWSWGQFKDVPANHWARYDITVMGIKQVFRGYEDGRFGPKDPVTRMQLVCLALRVMGLEDDALAAGGERARQTVRQSFSDAADVPTWPGAQEALAYAYEHGFLYGLCYQDRARFRPDAPATRLEVVATLLEAMGLREQAQAMSGASLNAPDATSVPSWARGYIALALQIGLLRGDERGYLQPNASVTREQMAAFLRRADRYAYE